MHLLNNFHSFSFFLSHFFSINVFLPFEIIFFLVLRYFAFIDRLLAGFQITAPVINYLNVIFILFLRYFFWNEVFRFRLFHFLWSYFFHFGLGNFILKFNFWRGSLDHIRSRPFNGYCYAVLPLLSFVLTINRTM